MIDSEYLAAGVALEKNLGRFAGFARPERSKKRTQPGSPALLTGRTIVSISKVNV